MCPAKDEPPIRAAPLIRDAFSADLDSHLVYFGHKCVLMNAHLGTFNSNLNEFSHLQYTTGYTRIHLNFAC